MARLVIVFVVLLIVWLSAGRRVTSLLDRMITTRVLPLPVNPLRYDGGGFRIGDLQMTFAGTNNLRWDLQLTSDTLNRVCLSTAGDVFTLGPRANPVDASGRPDIDFIAEPGDELSFSARQSVAGWPTPFEFRIIGGPTPWWKRYVYYTLLWKKPSAAKLEMIWRYEQQYFKESGWTKPAMMWKSQTGLIAVRIHRPPYEDAVVRYAGERKHWGRDEYRIESRDASGDGKSEVVALIFLADERSRAPGAGQSLELYVDRSSGHVIRELAGQ
jgi:hypothetical protein